MDDEIKDKEYTELSLDEYPRFIDEFGGNGIITPDHKIITLTKFIENHALFKKHLHQEMKEQIEFVVTLNKVKQEDRSEEFNIFYNDIVKKVSNEIETLMYVKGYVRVISYSGHYITFFGNEEAIEDLGDYVIDMKEYSKSECYIFWL